ncbi:MAG: hypothetical protein ACYDBB_00745 [Armatimonadota bacterium]
MPEQPIAPVAEQEQHEKPPWYSLNPKHLRFSKFTWYFLAFAGVVILLYTVSAKPLWQWGWRNHFYCLGQFFQQKDANGKYLPAGAWTKSKEIRVYGEDGVSRSAVDLTASGLKSIINEVGLDITVRQVPVPADAMASIKAATFTDAGGTYFDFDKYEGLRLAQRGMQYGEMVVVKNTFKDPIWAHGLTYFPSGLAGLQEIHADASLGRHEGAHLIGYCKHDDMPFWILG